MSGTTQPSPALGDLLTADVPCVAVSFADDADDAAITGAAAAGMDVAEIRIDRFTSLDPGHVVAQVRRFDARPTIATIRAATEGGGWDGDETRRLALYEAVLPWVGGLDVEASSTTIADRVVAAAKQQQRVAVVSFHDFERTPPEAELRSRIDAARSLGADVVKIATMAHHTADLRTLARILVDDHGVGLIVIGMGTLGAPSRLLFPFLGSRLTFAAVGRPGAPGQLPLDRMAATFAELSPAWAARHDRAPDVRSA